MTLTVGSLFSGIGGLDLGLERAGMRIVWQSENDPYASQVLAKHWPDVPNLGDITAVDWSHVERPDLICGGYPCQPFSLAGARNGTADPRHLWPHFAASLRALRPDWALLENVPGHLSLGFDTVHADLAALGYNTEWECIPATAVGAPHLRYRLFVVAHTNSKSEPGGAVNAQPGPWELVSDAVRDELREQPVTLGRCGRQALAGDNGPDRAMAHPDGVLRSKVDSDQVDRPHTFGPAGRLGRSGWWDVEPDVGRVADGVPRRVDRLRTLGNAVVPQVAEYVGRRILQAAA